MNTRTITCLAALAGLALNTGCTTLGAMPGMTMANAIPQDRMGGELGVALVPGFHLSDAVQEQAEGTLHGQLSGFFDPGEALGVARGLGLGVRYIGNDDGYFEPMVRYRFYLDDQERVATAIVAYGTHASGSERGASYRMDRGGLELSTDIRVTPSWRWLELHVTGGASVTFLSARGTYCLNSDTGWGRDCDEDTAEQGDTTRTLTAWLPGLFVGATLDLFRDVPIVHIVRLGAYMSGGSMPVVKQGETADMRGWYAMGLNLMLGIGDW